MRRFVFTVVLLITITAIAAPAIAMSGDLIDIIFDCDQLTITYTTITFDRDNMGTGEESYFTVVTDGAGNTIMGPSSVIAAVGTTIPPMTEIALYSTAPVSNPIRLRLVSDAGNGLSEQVVWDISGDCPDLPPSGSADGAPGIPAGFALATIICDVPVYNTPAGQPVGDAAITAGQTWYINPVPVDGDDGQQWTEIFVSSTTNPYIPTACIQ